MLLVVLALFGALAVASAWQVNRAVRRAIFGAYLSAVQNAELAKRAALLRSDEVTLIFVGDIMLSRSVGEEMEKRGDFRYPFLEVAESIRRADIAVGNLEGPISSRGRNQGSQYSFRADPRAVGGLAFSGFDVLSLANNHIWDWGADALTDTVRLLQENGIQPVGAGGGEEEANRAVVRETGGARIAFLSYTNLYPEALEAKGSAPGISDFERREARVREAALAADVVVVLLHWGDEYEMRSNNIQQEVGRRLIDAGADLVVGHHPHVIQEIEAYGDGWIAYSLGNFVFDQTFSEATTEGLVLIAHIENKTLTSIETKKVFISETFQPKLGNRNEETGEQEIGMRIR